LKIAICDDEVNDIELLYGHISSHKLEHEISQFTSAKPLLKSLYSGERFDLLFLDVQMPDSDGWEIAKEIKAANIHIYIAMATVMGGYIYDCFDRVDWFAVKPVQREKIHQILDNVQQRISPKVFEFQSDKLTLKLTAPEIIYVEGGHNDIFIHTVKGCHKVRLSLKEFLNVFDDLHCFFRPHRSVVINLDYYEKIESWGIVLKNGKKIHLTKNNRKPFCDMLSQYIMKE